MRLFSCERLGQSTVAILEMSCQQTWTKKYYHFFTIDVALIPREAADSKRLDGWHLPYEIGDEERKNKQGLGLRQVENGV